MVVEVSLFSSLLHHTSINFMYQATHELLSIWSSYFSIYLLTIWTSYFLLLLFSLVLLDQHDIFIFVLLILNISSQKDSISVAFTF